MRTAVAAPEPFGDMTLGEATDRLSGPPVPHFCIGEPLCRCQRAGDQAARLRRGAHIVARLLADLAERRRASPLPILGDLVVMPWDVADDGPPPAGWTLTPSRGLIWCRWTLSSTRPPAPRARAMCIVPPDVLKGWS